MLVFDEVEYAKNLLEKGFEGFVSLKDLSIIAKYLREEENLGFKKIEKRLIEFCVRCNPSFNVVKNAKFIQRAIASARNYNLRRPEAVVITESEIEKIRSVNNWQYEKVLFVMLVVGKFFKFGTKKKVGRKPKLLGYFANVKLADIVLLAKLRMSKQQRNDMLHYFYCNKFIDTTYTGGLRLCYADDNSTAKIIVTDYGDISNYYELICSECGAIVDRKFYKTCLCSVCYKKSRHDSAARVEKYRAKTKMKT